jgi:hypothetical protein
MVQPFIDRYKENILPKNTTKLEIRYYVFSGQA